MSAARRLSSLELLRAVVYELLDAHLDTLELAGDLPGEEWHAHLDYLRALQRKAHELLADAGAGDPTAFRRTPR